MKPALLIPICGESTRFGGRLKWLLTHPHGKTMLAKSVEGLSFDYDLYIITLREHNDKYGYIGKVDEQFRVKPNWIILDERTSSQTKTVYEGIKKIGLSGPILIKDCDNFFELDKMDGNCVAVCDLMKTPLVEPRNKSYIEDKYGKIIRIKEKQIISSLFCCGLYSFENSLNFTHAYENTHHQYISQIIQYLTNYNVEFSYTEVNNYEDWGELKDWQNYCRDFSVLFCDIDGVLVENSAEAIRPYWGKTQPIIKNIDRLNKLTKTGKVQLILTTSRKQSYENVTRKQLDDAGLRYSQIIFGLQHGKRTLINDYSDSNPYPSCDAINLKRNGDELEKLL